MTRKTKMALLIRLILQMKHYGSWAGETHIQKAAYFLQNLFRVPLGYKFILYKHGPYAFDLTDELVSIRADGFLRLIAQPYPYGPSLEVEEISSQLEKEQNDYIRLYDSAIAFVAKKLGDKRVVDLEKLATAFYVTAQLSGPKDTDSRAKKIVELKPHVSLADAKDAVQSVDKIVEEAKASNLI